MNATRLLLIYFCLFYILLGGYDKSSSERRLCNGIAYFATLPGLINSLPNVRLIKPKENMVDPRSSSSQHDQ